MELDQFTGRPCKSSLAFEFLPKKKEKLDLASAAKQLRMAKVEVEVETPVLLMVKLECTDLSLFRNGKIMVKETREEAKAREKAEKLLKLLKTGRG